ncbi:MAG: MCE family protein [Planctomycetes bacterium]|nr:MCE family protein [Planctomycetota bacterium]
MTAPANRWKLGLFVIGGLAATAIGMTWIGMRNWKRAYHTAYAYFDEALTGLEEGSPVKFRGVTIGTVERIRVASDKKHLQVQASLYDDYLAALGLDVERLEDECPLPENLRAQVVMSWVTSTSFIQVDFFPDPPSGAQQLPFPVGANTLRTVPSTAKGLEDASRELLRELPSVAAAARELVVALRDDLAAARLPELGRRLHAVLELAERQLQELERQRTIAAATEAVRSVGGLADAWQAETGPVTAALHEVQGAAASLRAQLDELQLPATAGSVRTAGASLAAAADDLRGEVAQLRRTLGAIERLAALLERDPGAVLHGRSLPARSPLEESR